MEDAQIILERHEQRIRAIERDISDLKAVHIEIRTMNETLVTLATELKHTNEHLARHEKKIDSIEKAHYTTSLIYMCIKFIFFL